MKKVALFLVFLLTITSLTSCRYFKRSTDTKVIYTVKVSTLNVRSSVRSDSKVLGQLHMGDTIFPTYVTPAWWVQFDFKNGKGYVKDKYLTSHRIKNMSRVSNMEFDDTTSFIRDSVNKYINWRKGIFWLIALGSIFLAWALTAIGKAIENALDFWAEDYGYNRLPFYAAIVGGLYSFAYMFWREDVLQAFFVTKFWWFPAKGSEWLMYYLWSASLILALSIAYYVLRDLIRYRFKALITLPYYALTAGVMFIMGLSLGVVAIVAGFVWIFLMITGEFSRGGSGFSGVSLKPSSSGKISREEEFRLFRKREDKFNADLKASELRKALDWKRMKMKDD